MKVCIKRTSINIVKDQTIRIASPFVPQQIIQVVPVIDYIVSNKQYIQKKKCCLLAHPRKIAKTIPSMAVGNIINSDMMTNAVDHIHDKNVHELAHSIVVFVKYAMMVL